MFRVGKSDTSSSRSSSRWDTLTELCRCWTTEAVRSLPPSTHSLIMAAARGGGGSKVSAASETHTHAPCRCHRPRAAPAPVRSRSARVSVCSSERCRHSRSLFTHFSVVSSRSRALSRSWRSSWRMFCV